MQIPGREHSRHCLNRIESISGMFELFRGDRNPPTLEEIDNGSLQLGGADNGYDGGNIGTEERDTMVQKRIRVDCPIDKEPFELALTASSINLVTRRFLRDKIFKTVLGDVIAFQLGGKRK